MMAAPKSECPAATGQAHSENTDAAIIAPAEKTGNSEKDFATLRAEYALRGHVLYRDDAEGYLAERWGFVRYLPTWTDALIFLAQLGGRHG